jgi:hypothetical protein
MQTGSLSSMPNGEEILKEISPKRNEGEKWPGELTEVMKQIHDFNPLEIPENARPDFLHAFDELQISELATAAGFTILKLVQGFHPGHPSLMRSENSNLQLIAKKPL